MGAADAGSVGRRHEPLSRSSGGWNTSGANQTDDSYLLFLVALAQAGAQGLMRSVGCPWVPAFAGMTKGEGGY
jgi:hypothetical protein